MKCPRCQADTRVLRATKAERRRRCINPKCGHRFNTVELGVDELGQMRADSMRLARLRNLINEAGL